MKNNPTVRRRSRVGKSGVSRLSSGSTSRRRDRKSFPTLDSTASGVPEAVVPAEQTAARRHAERPPREPGWPRRRSCDALVKGIDQTYIVETTGRGFTEYELIWIRHYVHVVLFLSMRSFRLCVGRKTLVYRVAHLLLFLSRKNDMFSVVYPKNRNGWENISTRPCRRKRHTTMRGLI